MKRLILLCLLAFPLVSCVRERALTREMDRVEACIHEKPDSALALIRKLDGRSFPTKGLRARHALLLTMAQDKCYIDVADDTTIRVAYDYYLHH